MLGQVSQFELAPYNFRFMCPPAWPERGGGSAGPAGSGAPAHFHCDAWNAVAHGRKLWLLQPPAAAEYSATPVLQWLHQLQNNESRAGRPRPFHCVQEAGDVLYVPCDWCAPLST